MPGTPASLCRSTRSAQCAGAPSLLHRLLAAPVAAARAPSLFPAAEPRAVAHCTRAWGTAASTRGQHNRPGAGRARAASGAAPGSMQSPAVNELGAFIDPDAVMQGAAGGPLAGMRVAVKDLFDMEGHRTGFGHPLWRATHAPATATAPAVAALLAAGASVAGRTHMDELAYSLNGENFHYGTPANAAAPGRIPGGSSSGSAAAVAAGCVEIGLGSDTGGSVRIPASFCGLFGLRPTHGRVSLEGARPLAPSFDTAGWFTRSMADMQRVSHVMLAGPAGSPGGQHQLRRLLVGTDAFALASAPTRDAVHGALQAALRHMGPGGGGAVQGGQQQGAGTLAVEDAEVAGGEALHAAGLGKLTLWLDVFRVCQAGEIWEQHGGWITEHQPVFGPGVKERFEMASKITPEEWKAARAQREVVTRAVRSLLGSDGVLALPTAPGPAPLCGTPAAQLNEWRLCMISLTCIAGLTGLPQVTLPVATVEGGLPVGLSLIGPYGSDEALLEVAARVAGAAAAAVGRSG